MNKFKAGDVVTYNGTFNYAGRLTEGKQYTILSVKDGYWNRIIDDKGMENGWRDDLFDLAEPAGPVRTVTRREIVPGVYGKVNVLGRSGIIGRENHLELCMNGFHDADELRSAAMVLSQLAEALDDNKDAGK